MIRCKLSFQIYNIINIFVRANFLKLKLLCVVKFIRAIVFSNPSNAILKKILSFISFFFVNRVIFFLELLIELVKRCWKMLTNVLRASVNNPFKESFY